MDHLRLRNCAELSRPRDNCAKLSRLEYALRTQALEHRSHMLELTGRLEPSLSSLLSSFSALDVDDINKGYVFADRLV